MRSAEEDLLEEIGERLSLLKRPSLGYKHQIKVIGRARADPFEPGDIPALNYYSTSDTFISKAYGIETRAITVVIESHAMTRDKPFNDVARELKLDIVTAINRATTAPKVSDQPSLKLGGLADNVVFTESLYLIGEGQAPWCAARVEMEVSYKTRAGEVELFVE